MESKELENIKTSILKNLDLICDKLEINKNQIILFGFRGSIAHNLYLEGSDVDLMVIYCNPIDNYLSVRSTIKESVHLEIEIDSYKLDIVGYDIRKIFSLLLNSNPNVIDFLFMDKDMYIYSDNLNIGRDILLAKSLFLSKDIARTYGAYGLNQLERMTKIDDKSYNGYMGEKRKDIVDKFGYDTKNASHCIRLLTTALEVLETGVLQVKREYDRYLYLDIKLGKYSLERIKNLATSLEDKLNIYESIDSEVLPHSLDTEKIQRLLLDSIKSWDNYICRSSKKLIDTEIIEKDQVNLHTKITEEIVPPTPKKRGRPSKLSKLLEGN